MIQRIISEDAVCFVWREPGEVELSLIDVDRLVSTPGAWMVTRINVHSQARGRGIGLRLMSELCKWADSEQLILLLGISPYGDLNYKQLHRFFSRFGFIDNKNMPGIMRREPAGS